uniref:Uncharacterized protein n=1 Tax=Arundo donax TaxID=35708 RepID=A0A0A9BED2_ARUDO
MQDELLESLSAGLKFCLLVTAVCHWKCKMGCSSCLVLVWS